MYKINSSTSSVIIPILWLPVYCIPLYQTPTHYYETVGPVTTFKAFSVPIFFLAALLQSLIFNNLWPGIP